MFAYPSSLMGPSASSLVIVALDLFACVPLRPRDKIRRDGLPLRFRPGRARAQCLTMLYAGVQPGCRHPLPAQRSCSCGLLDPLRALHKTYT